MSQQSPFGARGRQLFPTLPSGVVVASYESYVDAQAAVDVLARADFPVAQLSIVGNDLKSVERVTGKLTWGRVALAGAASGAWMGVFFGLLLLIFSPNTAAGFGVLAAAVLIGAGFGMMFGLVSYGINRRRRDFTSTMQVIASNYSIIAAPEIAVRAESILGSSGSAGRGARVERGPDEFTQAPASTSSTAENPAATDASDRSTRSSRPLHDAYGQPLYGERLPVDAPSHDDADDATEVGAVPVQADEAPGRPDDVSRSEGGEPRRD